MALRPAAHRHRAARRHRRTRSRIDQLSVLLNDEQERRKADFRFSLVRLRENADGVALYGGEHSEAGLLHQRFQGIQANWWQLMRYTKRLTFFTAGYNQASVRLPLLVSAPRFFAGDLQLGDLMQISSAFGQVADSLSWFINAYGQLADWKASVDRMLTFHDVLERLGSEADQSSGVRLQSHAAPGLHVEGLRLDLPDGNTILSDGGFSVERGKRVVILGPSGTGKSTLFRAIAGIWPYGQGRVSLPENARVLFLPQKPYIPIGTLREAVVYPASSNTFTDAAIGEVLDAVLLDQLAAHLDERQNWSMQLSGGEQQRLAIARAFLQRPDWLFLDEATSALGPSTESRMYALLRERLADATIVSIAHHPPADDFHQTSVELVPSSSGADGATLQTMRLSPMLLVAASYSSPAQNGHAPDASRRNLNGAEKDGHVGHGPSPHLRGA